MLQLTPHDVVNLKLNKGDASTPSLGQGIVYRIKDNAIIIAVDDVPEDGLDSPLRLEKLANEVTYRRLKDTLIELSKGVQKGPASDLVSVLFGSKAPSFSKQPITYKPFNTGLDHSQVGPFLSYLNASDVSSELLFKVHWFMWRNFLSWVYVENGTDSFVSLLHGTMKIVGEQLSSC
jgi:hypothetical protein